MSFVLRNICPDLILHKFKIMENKNIKPLNKTCLSNIMHNEQPIVSYLDKAKNKRSCVFVMINTNKSLNTDFKYHCYWCKHVIENSPIGIPIDYVYNTKIKKYYSKRNNENYVIHEKTLDDYICDTTGNISLHKNSYYITEGIVCSWNCGISYINEKKNNKRYTHSLELFYNMYKECNNIPKETVVNIKPSPHWKLLDVFGGNWNIKEFRSKFNKYEYINQGKMFLDTKYIGHLFEEKVSFN